MNNSRKITFLESLDPRSKIIGGALLFCAAMLADDWSLLAALCVPVFIAMAASGAALRRGLKDIWILRFIILVTIGVHLLISLLDGGVSAAGVGLYRGLFFSAKIALLTTTGGLILRSTLSGELWMGLESLIPRPLRTGSAGKLVFVLGMALQFFPLIMEESQRIRRSQIGRGLVIRSGLSGQIYGLWVLLAPLVSATLMRAGGITDAMLARGYRTDFPRTRYRPLRMSAADVVTLVTLVTLVLILWGDQS